MANDAAREEKLYDSAVAAVQQIKLPDRATLKLQADSWLRAVIQGRPATLDLYTRWAMGTLDTDGGIEGEGVPEDIAHALDIKTYGDLT
jgi:hypothetical protein